uniref:Uncharacterized protein n=1 Tax=Anguilla anguilla TaxID=7936 RepID=A0A0E9PR24_ANGAN
MNQITVSETGFQWKNAIGDTCWLAS